MAGNTRIRHGVIAAVVALGATGAARGELIHRYSFTDGAKDSTEKADGKADGKLKGAAKVADGKLVLDNGEKTSGDPDLGYLDLGAAVLPKQGSASVVVWFTEKDKEGGHFARLLDIGSQDAGEGRAFVYLTSRNAEDNSRAAVSATDAASKANVDGARLDDNKPHVAAVVIDGTGKKLHYFIDGKPAAEAVDLADNTLDKVKQDHAWVGRSGFDADGGLTASIDEVRVYDEALTADKLTDLQKAGPDAPPTKPAGEPK